MAESQNADLSRKFRFRNVFSVCGSELTTDSQAVNDTSNVCTAYFFAFGKKIASHCSGPTHHKFLRPNPPNLTHEKLKNRPNPILPMD